MTNCRWWTIMENLSNENDCTRYGVRGREREKVGPSHLMEHMLAYKTIDSSRTFSLFHKIFCFHWIQLLLPLNDSILSHKCHLVTTMRRYSFVFVSRYSVTENEKWRQKKINKFYCKHFSVCLMILYYFFSSSSSSLFIGDKRSIDAPLLLHKFDIKYLHNYWVCFFVLHIFFSPHSLRCPLVVSFRFS